MDRWERSLNTASMQTNTKQVPQQASSRIVRCFKGCGFQWFHNRNSRGVTAQKVTIHIERLNVAPDGQNLHQQMSWASENIQTPTLKDDRCKASAHMLETKRLKVLCELTRLLEILNSAWPSGTCFAIRLPCLKQHGPYP